MHAFLDWIIEEWKRLEKDGIQVKGVHYKVKVLVITTDTIARLVIRNTTQFNGEFGCDFVCTQVLIKLINFTLLFMMLS